MPFLQKRFLAWVALSPLELAFFSRAKSRATWFAPDFTRAHTRKCVCAYLLETITEHTLITKAERKHYFIESPLKRTWPSGCLDGAKYMKNSRDFLFSILLYSLGIVQPTVSMGSEAFWWRPTCVRSSDGACLPDGTRGCSSFAAAQKWRVAFCAGRAGG